MSIRTQKQDLCSTWWYKPAAVVLTPARAARPFAATRQTSRARSYMYVTRHSSHPAVCLCLTVVALTRLSGRRLADPDWVEGAVPRDALARAQRAQGSQANAGEGEPIPLSLTKVRFVRFRERQASLLGGPTVRAANAWWACDPPTPSAPHTRAYPARVAPAEGKPGTPLSYASAQSREEELSQQLLRNCIACLDQSLRVARLDLSSPHRAPRPTAHRPPRGNVLADSCVPGL